VFYPQGNSSILKLCRKADVEGFSKISYRKVGSIKEEVLEGNTKSSGNSRAFVNG